LACPFRNENRPEEGNRAVPVGTDDTVKSRRVFVCPPIPEGPPSWWRGITEAVRLKERGQ